MNKTALRFILGFSLTFVICIALTLLLNYISTLYNFTTPRVFPGIISGIIVVLIMPILERRYFKDN